ncbi:uncharacterized protein METZ01_LOCUS298189 [marine metagenome]|jgi:hypothetical protein|uniref:Uncharacterized protein n=1 Tax=marine metagenome TaxID=408172 RepID=A0A382MBB1_9ZZZZ
MFPKTELDPNEFYWHLTEGTMKFKYEKSKHFI